MTLVNIHSIKPPQRRHDLQAIAQDHALIANAFFLHDAHAANAFRMAHDRAKLAQKNIAVMPALWVGE